MHIKKAISLRNSGFSLMETVFSVMVMGLVFSAVLLAYTESARRAEWSGMSLAAQAMATRQVEQFRAAKWDTQTIPEVDQTANIPTPVASVLDLPISGTNVVWATNTATITTIQISTTPLVNIKMITVNTVWPFKGVYFTNTIVAYRAPDQ